MMHLYRLLPKISEEYRADCKKFIGDIWRASESKMRYTMLDNFGNPVEVEGDYVVRFTPAYAKRVIAKFYALDEYHKTHQGAITLISLTSYQMGKTSVRACGGRTHEEAYASLKGVFPKIYFFLKYHMPGVQYLWFVEPHPTSGYPHVHLIVYGEVSASLQQRLKRLYADKWNIGSKKHGIDFSVLPNIESARNYALKYITKSLNTEDSPHTKPFDWTPEELLFYTLTRKHKWRLWGASAGLSELMKYRREEPFEYYWLKVEILNDTNDSQAVVWKNPLTPSEYWAQRIDSSIPFEL
jgi:hypothetical protein